MAAPHVTGAIALLMGYRPQLPYRDYIEALFTHAARKPSYQGRLSTQGRLDVFLALKSLTTRRHIPATVLRFLSRSPGFLTTKEVT